MNTPVTCLVTGGAGFIGSHLCDRLLEKGYRVVVVDNLITGSEKNVAHLLTHPQFTFLRKDVTQPFSFDFDRLDYVYHLASPASPVQYRKLAIETLLVNSVGTYHMLELSRKTNAFFILASTSEVYGNPRQHPQKEAYFGNVNPIGIRACYDEGKRFAEAITMEYVRKYEVKARIIRIFNTYGPRMQVHDGRVVSNFITQAISQKSLTMYGDGLQTRSFCYISDMVTGIISAMEKKGIDGEVINLGNPDEQTIKNIGILILKLTQSSSQLMTAQKKQADDPERRKPDIAKAKRLLNWYPRVELAEGLVKTIDYFKHI